MRRFSIGTYSDEMHCEDIQQGEESSWKLKALEKDVMGNSMEVVMSWHRLRSSPRFQPQCGYTDNFSHCD